MQGAESALQKDLRDVFGVLIPVTQRANLEAIVQCQSKDWKTRANEIIELTQACYKECPDDFPHFANPTRVVLWGRQRMREYEESLNTK